MICSKCKANNLEGQTFCGNCGAPLESSTAQSQDNYQREERPLYQAENVYGAYQGPYQGAPSNGGMIKPKSYQTESIIVTIVSTLCCGSLISTILGIIAIVKSSKVDNDFRMGNIQEATQNSESAKKLTIWASVIAVIWTIIAVILYFVAIAALIGTAGGLGILGL
ncbi:MAG: CD225/dispanin family protein [Tannerella sp.]|jgi:ABC-type multidrug transport system permease subunit|nr:CD225/dispanin family protein [Tannerella sp.]